MELQGRNIGPAFCGLQEPADGPAVVAMAKHGGLAAYLDLLYTSLSCFTCDTSMAALLLQVCNYPFTTRSIKMGHFYIDANRHQVGCCNPGWGALSNHRRRHTLPAWNLCSRHACVPAATPALLSHEASHRLAALATLQPLLGRTVWWPSFCAAQPKLNARCQLDAQQDR